MTDLKILVNETELDAPAERRGSHSPTTSSLFEGSAPVVKSSAEEIARFKEYVDRILASAAVGAEKALTTAGLDHEPPIKIEGDLIGATFPFETFIRGFK